jgi:type IV secretory pathway VirB2 component (pilin)
MDVFKNFLDGLPSQIYPIATGIAIVGLIIAGLQLMMGKRQKEEGKERAAAIVMGVCVVFLAAAVVMWLATFLGTVGGAAVP